MLRGEEDERDITYKKTPLTHTQRTRSNKHFSYVVCGVRYARRFFGGLLLLSLYLFPVSVDAVNYTHMLRAYSVGMELHSQKFSMVDFFSLGCLVLLL